MKPYLRVFLHLSAVLVIVLSSGCGSVPPMYENLEPARHDPDIVLESDATYPFEVYDPWEGFNRGVYNFNAVFDDVVFLPAVRAYRAVTPEFARIAISNFFSNLGEIRNFMNAALQGRLEQSVETAGRFAVNTTFGLAGLIDMATPMGIPEQQEDFGQTLGVWGVGSGPYLVLPIFGPSSLRDGIGLGTDLVVAALIQDELVDLNTEEEWALRLLNAINARHEVEFRYFETGSPFEYDLIRFLYKRLREFKVAN